MILSIFGLGAIGFVLAFTAEGAGAQTPPPAPESGKKSMDDDPAIQGIQKFIAQSKVDTKNPKWKVSLRKPPKATFDSATTYFWNLETNMGSITVKLLPDVAPMHVTSTIYLTLLGFYDGLTFHRVIDGFMAQGGCPLGTGSGGPGYKYEGEFSATVKHDRPGLLSMANAGPGTDGSQFFLTFVPTPWLDGKHTIFGEVVKGMDTLKKMEAAAGPRPSGVPPKEKIEIKKATISIE